MSTTTISNESLRTLTYDYSDDPEWESVERRFIEEWRWGEVYECIFKHVPTGKLYSYQVRIQSGDYDYNSVEDEGKEVEVHEVEAYEITTTAYRLVQS